VSDVSPFLHELPLSMILIVPVDFV